MAFFDLDKTILAKSSSLVFARPLYKGGLIGRAAVLKGAYAQFVYLTSGADHDQMERMRAYLQVLSKGWSVDQVRQIVADALDETVDPLIYTEALDLIREHQAAGREVIVISSSGTEIVEPICARLGVDRAVGTQMEIGPDGAYTGEILFYAYGKFKADAIAALAAEFDYDLPASYAYTDSHTDLPMLEAVGHPVAVNPDDALRAHAMELGWPVMDFQRPAALRSQVKAGRVKVAAGGAAAVAVGLTWYMRHRRN